VSVAGAGVLEQADDKSEAERFVEFLLSEDGQRFYTEEAEEAEYPLVAGIAPRKGLPPLTSLSGPDLDLSKLGAELESTLKLLSDTGYTS
jgi:iron(III) transport system substrate-binding protein